MRCRCPKLFKIKNKENVFKPILWAMGVCGWWVRPDLKPLTHQQITCITPVWKGSNPPFIRCWLYQNIIIKLVQTLGHWLGESVRSLMKRYLQLFLELFYRFVNICSMFLLCHAKTLMPFLTLFCQVRFCSLHWLLDFKSKARKRTPSVSSLALSGNVSRDSRDDGSIGIPVRMFLSLITLGS